MSLDNWDQLNAWITAPETVDVIKHIAQLAELETQEALAKLQDNRFANEGQFNDHEAWAPNVRPDIVYQKWTRPVLIDSGNLRNELTNPDNWQIDTKLSITFISLGFDEVENFTDPKYDQLENSDGGEYDGSRTGKHIKYKWKPPRMFKTLSAQDVEWVTDEVTKALVDKLA
jgi:hypothetical protein